MLATTVALHDIADVEGFVNATLNRSAIRFTHDERDDLVAEGLAILFDLAGRYEHQRAGYATSGTFGGFAAYFLPKKLTDAWHTSHPEHRRVTEPDGKRRWAYLKATLSLDGILAGDNNSAGADGNRAAGERESSFLPATHWVPLAAD